MNKPYCWLLNGEVWFKEPKETDKEFDGYEITPLYTHPVKELHLSLQKSQDGELLAVTYTDDEHRIVEVLWEKPPVKDLTDEEITEVFRDCTKDGVLDANDFAKAILRKASEK